MAQIKKDKKETEKLRIASLILENDTLLQNADIDQSRKDQAKAVVDFAQQVINSEEFTGRDLRIYNLGIQEAVNKILKGEQGYSESMTGDAKTNIFGYYSRHGNPSELDWMINETVKRGSLGNTEFVQLDIASVSPQTRQIVTISPASGFSSYVLPNTTIDLKVKKFAGHLYNQLNNYLNNPYDESLYIIKGIDKNAILNFRNYIGTLNSITNRTATPNDILTLGDIVSALGNEDLTNAFENYFSQELTTGEDAARISIPGQKPTSVLLGNSTLSLTQHPDSNLNQYFADKGYSLYKDAAGNYYVEGLTEDTAEINPVSNYYKYGFFIDPFTDLNSGKTYGKLVSYGNLEDANYLQTVKDRWASLAPKIRAKYNEKFAPVDYTTQGGERGIDLSNYFPGSDVIFIGGDKYGAWENGSDTWLPFNQWIENWDEKKSGFDWGGNADINIQGNNKNLYAKSLGFVSPETATILDPIFDIDDRTVLKKYGREGDAFGDINDSDNWDDKTVTYLLENKSELPFLQRLAQYIILYLLAEKNVPDAAKELEYIFPHDTYEYKGNQLGYLFMNQLRQNQNSYKELLKYCYKFAVSDLERQAILDEIKTPKSSQKLKNGGVIKMFLGGPAKDNSYEIAKYNTARMRELAEYKKSRGWQDVGRSEEGSLRGSTSVSDTSFWDLLDASDIARGAALALDIGSIFASNAPGWGTAVAGGLGITSMLTDLGADIADKSVSTKDAVVNAFANTGYALLGLIPDAKAMTTASKSLKWISRLVRRAGGIAAIAGIANLGIEDTQRLWLLITNPESREFTRDDLMIIFNTVRATTAGIAARKNAKTRSNIAKSALNSNKRNIPIIDGITKKNISVSEDLFKQIVNAGTTGGNKAAIAKLREIDPSLTENVQIPLDFGDTGGKWVRFKKAVGRNMPLHSAETSYETYGMPLKEGITDVKGLDANIALGTGTWDPDWFGWTKKINPTNPKTEPRIENGILSTKKKRSGGTLDKLRNYINNN